MPPPGAERRFPVPDFQLVDLLQPDSVNARLPVENDLERVPGFKDDGSPWTDAEVEAVWGELHVDASRFTEIDAGFAGDTDSSGR
jgi:hypothetical protein